MPSSDCEERMCRVFLVVTSYCKNRTHLAISGLN